MEPVPLCRCCNPAFMSSDEEWDDDMWEDPRPKEENKETSKFELDREWQTRREQHFNVCSRCKAAQSRTRQQVGNYSVNCRVVIEKARMRESRQLFSKHSMKVGTRHKGLWLVHELQAAVQATEAGLHGTQEIAMPFKYRQRPHLLLLADFLAQSSLGSTLTALLVFTDVAARIQAPLTL